ncbi:MAG TPA: hypothetical protein VFF65_10360 [Phycisphaerales bacterium]|nr:hypothetical protein [Phycisphaerales bacterium]
MFEHLAAPTTSSAYLDNAIAIHRATIDAMRPDAGERATPQRSLIGKAMLRCNDLYLDMKAAIDGNARPWTIAAAARAPLELATRILAAQRGIDGWDRLIGYWSGQFDTQMRLAGMHIPALAGEYAQLQAAAAQLPPLQGVPLQSLELAVQEIVRWDEAHPGGVFAGDLLRGFYDTDIRALHACAHVNMIWVDNLPGEAAEAIWRNAVNWSVLFMLRAAGDVCGRGDAWATEVLTRQLLTTAAQRQALAAELRGQADR